MEANTQKGASATDGDFDIPLKCKAGIVVNEGANFHVEVQMVDVPQPGILYI